MTAWIARDENGELWMCEKKPHKVRNQWCADGYVLDIKADNFPQVKWEDEEPTEVKITIKKKGGTQ